jgi:DNA-binding response OmpR family regulator
MDDPVASSDGVVIDADRRLAHRDGRNLKLSPREFEVLAVLIDAGGRIVGTEELLLRVWSRPPGPSEVVRGVIHNLRWKLGHPSPVLTEMSSGYRWMGP